MIVASLRVLFSSCSPGPHWLGADMYPHVFAASAAWPCCITTADVTRLGDPASARSVALKAAAPAAEAATAPSMFLRWVTSKLSRGDLLSLE